MSWRARFVGAAAALALGASAAAAQTTIKWLHIEANPAAVKIWEEAARAFEAGTPGVRVEMQFLENEAYKAKLPTILQSRDRPHLIYSWGGGVLREQAAAGVLEDVTAQVKDAAAGMGAGALSAFTVDGRLHGLPFAVSQVGFMVNRELMARGQVDAAAIATWDDLLGAVRKLKAAGVVPMMVGGADKWPLHFYWTNLAVRLGGKAAFEAALRGEGGGFEGETFVRSGELFKQLVDLQPFQNGFLGYKNPQAVGAFGDGRAAMILAISSWYATQRTLAADKLAWVDFPTVPGGKGAPSDTLGGVTGWLVTKGAPKETVEFLKFFVSREWQTRLAQANILIPTVKGAEAGLATPFVRAIATTIANAGYHQNFYDQALGPSVGRVVNDATSEIAGGTMTPREAARAIQQAYRQGS